MEVLSSDESLMEEFFASSDTDDNDVLHTQSRSHGGSKNGRMNKNRPFEEHYKQLVDQYFSATARYSEEDFVRRFRMKKCVFEQVFNDVQNADEYFTLKANCANKVGIHPLVKVSACLCILGYSAAFDQMDEIFGIGESTMSKCFHRFCELIPRIYNNYLQLPNEQQLKEMMDKNAERGFPGMIGSIDCTVIKWRNCPMAHKAAYCGPKTKVPTIQLEAVCDSDLYVWHSYFGMPGASNDINVLDSSPLLDKISSGEFPPRIQYLVNGTVRDLPYMLADGIYPKWPIFAIPMSEPTTDKEKKYTKLQESVRKDIERAFGILKIRFQCLEKPCKFWKIEQIENMVKTCIIFHNMIIATRNQDVLFDEYDESETMDSTESTEVQGAISYQNEDDHYRLRSLLIDHNSA